MSENIIKCPSCGNEIPLTEALTGTIREGLRTEIEAGARRKEKELTEKVKELKEKEKQLQGQQDALADEVEKRLKNEREVLKQSAYAKAQEEAALQQKTLEAELKIKVGKLQEAQERELKLLKEREELEERQKNLDLEVSRRIDEQRKKLVEETQAAAAKKVQEEFALKAQDWESQIKEKDEKLKEANQHEIELRRQQRELEAKQQNLELEVARKMDEERKKIAEDAITKAGEQQQLKMREKEDMIKSLQTQLENLQRKIEAGSQERQGEALEEQLKEILQQSFPMDEIEDVAKGQRGGDLIQNVRNVTGKICGKILWESKNTKDFNKNWIDKLKQDQQAAGASIAVLMTMSMPKEIKQFDLYNDVWVTDYSSAIGLCTVLRQMLISVAREKLVSLHQDSLKDVIYSYITGQEFSSRVKAVVMAYTQMQIDLDSEKRAMLRIWKKREKQIQSVLNNTSEMFGEIEGMLGGQKLFAPIEPLMLEAVEPDEGDEQ
jgi:hypothetical protein